MTMITELTGPHKNFEDIKKLDENGVEYWEARELMPLLGYEQWRRFEEILKKAQLACMKSGQSVADHFADAGKMVAIGSNTVRKIQDYHHHFTDVSKIFRVHTFFFIWIDIHHAVRS